MSTFARPSSGTKPPRSQLGAALLACRHAFVGIGMISGVLNVLTLSGSFFMLQVYDRVIPSHSVPTLLGLVVLVIMLYLFQGFLDVIRSRVLVRIGASLDESLGRQVYDAVVQQPLNSPARGDGLQSLRDLDQIRSYLSSLGPTAFFDAPWMPLYLVICFAFHPLIGITAIIGAVILFGLTIATELGTRTPSKVAADALSKRNRLAEASRRNAEVLHAMGLAPRLALKWEEANTAYLTAQRQSSDVAGSLSSASKITRMVLQSGILALGAWLVIHQEASSGIMIASSILMSRALAPVELAIGHWKNFGSTRQSWRRLEQLLPTLSSQQPPMPLPAPTESLAVEALSVAPPGSQKLTVQNASFTLQAGQGMGIIGPSASGKSSLARALVGVWRPVKGTVRLDGAALNQWCPNALGAHIGYMPQDVELFSGTVAENISRFEEGSSSDAIIAASRAAGVHDLILNLPQGYETQIGENGTALSAGQQQRIGLARALYGDPFLIVLDEPNSNLDSEGDQALTNAIQGVRDRGGIIIVVAHRPSALASIDHILTLGNGQVQAFGPKDEVLNKVLNKPVVQASRPPLSLATNRPSGPL